MPDWKDLANEIAETVAKTRADLWPSLDASKRESMRELESTFREIAQKYESGEFSPEVRPEDAWQHEELWRVFLEVKQSRGDAGIEPLEELASRMMYAGPHGTGKPPRE